MEFWKASHPDDALVAIDARSGEQWCYLDLRRDVARVQQTLPALGRKSLGLLVAQNRYECLVTYLAALNSGSALILVDTSLNPQLLHEFIAAYEPDWIYTLQAKGHFDGYHASHSGVEGLLENQEPRDLEMHPELALLLTTSGSTGSPKLVRLTLRNLAVNAQSIAQYLRLTPTERPITSLPLSYSYGLSVINSHLTAGASLLFTEDGVLQ